MLPSEVRARVLEDHRKLRSELDRLETLARSDATGEAVSAELREVGERVLEHLAVHMRWEDENLAPALREADAWGEERESRLAIEHRDQRRALRDLLDHVRDSTRAPDVLARELVSFLHWLRRDMDSEEAIFLDPKVLRDDVVAVDASTG